MDRVARRGSPRRGAVERALALALALAAGACFRGNDEVTSEGEGGTMTAAFTTSTTTTTSTTSTSAAETTTSTTTTTADISTGDPVDVTAFRVTSAAIVDPHSYYMLSPQSPCSDITAILNSGLLKGLEEGSVNIVMAFAPADPAVTEVGFRVINGKCNGALDTCAPADGVIVADSSANNTVAGLCNLLLPGTYNPDYAADGAPNIPSAPCFASDEADVTIDLSGSLPALELTHAQAAATYQGADGIDGLIKGTLRGYLTESKGKAVVGELDNYAFDLWGSIAGAEGCQADPDQPIDDTDPNPDPESAEAGVWIYLNFEAVRVEWLE